MSDQVAIICRIVRKTGDRDWGTWYEIVPLGGCHVQSEGLQEALDEEKQMEAGSLAAGQKREKRNTRSLG